MAPGASSFLRSLLGVLAAAVLLLVPLGGLREGWPRPPTIPLSCLITPPL
ncbi:hypothetical protein AAJV73_13270 [Cyanobium sp. BSA11S]